jgi:hypothetical protein
MVKIWLYLFPQRSYLRNQPQRQQLMIYTVPETTFLKGSLKAGEKRLLLIQFL